ncbi:MAG: Dicer-like protein 1 [Chaenotheca gracillima]|nr:MAG: Dicer-like protein 1 [Chaenotheca gracillima]
MLSSLLRPRRSGGRRADRSPFSSPFSAHEQAPLIGRRIRGEDSRRPAAQHEQGNDPESDEPLEDEDEEAIEDEEEDEEGEDEDNEVTPLLPLFSAAHLDALPVYNLTHVIRLLVTSRCETTLSWDQLRSPQVSQFLVKPIQQQIRTSHFSRATIYALMANGLQFVKESHSNPGNSGVSRTRALVCELLAMKLLKEFTSRELIGMMILHALSYDFDPLQGLSPPNTTSTTPPPNWDAPRKTRSQTRAARISTLEISIQAQAKRFLAHPLVVQHLEAIWAGTIVFHSSADSLHRETDKVTPNQTRGYATTNNGPRVLQASPDKLQPAKQRDHQRTPPAPVRRSVTLYDPRDASLFKLSRLRVPRYRQVLSTCSLAVLLCLFVAVLVERSLDITPLEVIFWFWSAGFMLDELVGFNEQGFGLYILSVWNSFDLGILLILIVYYAMRLYGILMSGDGKDHVKNMAYDVLAANAVLLFPRLFSVLDHYRYFSQLLIAFRMMFMDLVAVFVLIIISCSGFFVAFTLSFGESNYDARGVLYALFQMLMGFTPAAWNVWDQYNVLGKLIMTLFLFICHFLIVTILITVLTNSFMAIVANANDEHQFLFAINTISMVKSDALFSYVAPTNIIAWILTPLRYFISFRRFVKLNRTVIKVTHFPILFMIFAYERMILQPSLVDPTDIVVSVARPSERQVAFDGRNNRVSLFSPQARLRQGSVVNYQTDRALDEVFRRVPKDANLRTPRNQGESRKSSNVVDHWMQGMGSDGRASPPLEQDRSIVDRLETRRNSARRPPPSRRKTDTGSSELRVPSRSVASDPEEFQSTSAFPTSTTRRSGGRDISTMSMDSIVEQTAADADDELHTNDEDENANATLDHKTPNSQDAGHEPAFEEDYFRTPIRSNLDRQVAGSLPSNARARFRFPTEGPSSGAGRISKPLNPHTRHHSRNVSSSTVLLRSSPKNVHLSNSSSPSTSPSKTPVASANRTPKGGSGTHTPKSNAVAAGRRSPRRPGTARPRPIMPPRTQFQSVPNLAGMLVPSETEHLRPLRHRASSIAFDLTSDTGGNLNVIDAGNILGAVPSSFATQMAMATAAARLENAGGGRGGGRGRRGALAFGGGVREGNSSAADDSRMMSRLVLARMKTLEEGFGEVLKEVREMKRDRVRDA